MKILGLVVMSVPAQYIGVIEIHKYNPEMPLLILIACVTCIALVYMAAVDLVINSQDI
jgi:hypothetical protein